LDWNGSRCRAKNAKGAKNESSDLPGFFAPFAFFARQFCGLTEQAVARYDFGHGPLSPIPSSEGICIHGGGSYDTALSVERNRAPNEWREGYD
jgi:hypothetical protein